MPTEKDFAVALQWICFGISFVSFGFYAWKVSHGGTPEPRASVDRCVSRVLRQTLSMGVSAGKKDCYLRDTTVVVGFIPHIVVTSRSSLCCSFPWNPTVPPTR